MTTLTYENFPETLRSGIPGFDRVYDEHVADNADVLPHVLLGDLVRFLSKEVEQNGSQSGVLRRAMVLLESAMGSADPRLHELVAVSFLENLDPEDPNFEAFKQLFGKELEREYEILND